MDRLRSHAAAVVALVGGGALVVASILAAAPAGAVPGPCSGMAANCIGYVSGSGQTTAVGTPYAAPLEVQVGSDHLGGTVQFSVTTGNARFGSSSSTTVSVDSNGYAATSVTSNPLSPTSAGPVTVQATVDHDEFVTFTLYTCGTSTTAAACTTPSTTVAPTSVPPTSTPGSPAEPPPYSCIGAGCSTTGTVATPAVSVSPVVLPETAPTSTPVKTGTVSGAASLANTGADTQPLTAAGVALIAVGLVALGASTRRRRSQG